MQVHNQAKSVIALHPSKLVCVSSGKTSKRSTGKDHQWTASKVRNGQMDHAKISWHLFVYWHWLQSQIWHQSCTVLDCCPNIVRKTFDGDLVMLSGVPHSHTQMRWTNASNIMCHICEWRAIRHLTSLGSAQIWFSATLVFQQRCIIIFIAKNCHSFLTHQHQQVEFQKITKPLELDDLVAEWKGQFVVFGSSGYPFLCHHSSKWKRYNPMSLLCASPTRLVIPMLKNNHSFPEKAALVDFIKKWKFGYGIWCYRKHDILL